jgi:hypothetical protein|tara:strand:+ start:1678 stop:2016 length:339 start_codon:yes stop_codon:yes gene_type:complete
VKTLNEDKLAKIVIDLNELKKQRLDESFLAMFGHWVKSIVGAIFGDTGIPVSVKGNPSDVRAFASAVAGEARYVQAAKDFGLDHPRTYMNKAQLEKAVKDFESSTGIKWPFK